MEQDRLYLIGYRCTGKSAVGRSLAYQLKWAFCDTDRLIKQHIDTTIKEFFDMEGEDPFREIEADMLNETIDLPEAVISTGGGIILRDENRQLLSENGVVIWLRAEPDTIRERMVDDEQTEDERPALSGTSPVEEVEEVLDERKDLYDEAADYSISTDELSPGSVAEYILDELQPDE